MHDASVQVPKTKPKYLEGKKSWTKRSKMDQKAVKLVFVGYCDERTGYRFLDRSNNGITVSRDAKVIELVDGSEQPVIPKKVDVPR